MKIGSMQALEVLGRVRLSENFFMRDFLYSEIANFHGLRNVPDDPNLAIEAGTQLCLNILEPLHRTFGRVVIRSAYRSALVNDFGNRNKLNCSSNEANYARHIWDRRDADDCIGATACVVVPWFLQRYEIKQDWQRLAWWVHDHLPYSEMMFFPNLAAFNVSWREKPLRTIYSQVPPRRGWLTKPGMDNHGISHVDAYEAFPPLQIVDK